MDTDQPAGMKYRGYALGNLYPKPRGIVKTVLLSLFSRRFLQAARFERRFLTLRLTRFFGGRSRDLQGKVYLNIAPGRQSHERFFNIDAFNYPGLDCVFDCRRHLPFGDGSLLGIFTEHFIEHLDYIDEFGDFLSECRRVLQSGGTLRMVTPDAEKYFQSYTTCKLEAMEKIRNAPPGSYNTRMEIINELFHQGVEHKFIFDKETLMMRCKASGFNQIEACSFRAGRDESLLIDRDYRRDESLYVEATK